MESEKLNELKRLTQLNDINSLNILQDEIKALTNDKVPYWNNETPHISNALWNPHFHAPYNTNLPFVNIYMTSRIETPHLCTQQESNGVNTLISDLHISPCIKPYIYDNLITKKIKLLLSENQKRFFKLCTGVHRLFYNKAIEQINNRYYAKQREFNNSPTCVKCHRNKEPDSYFCSNHIYDRLPWQLGITMKNIRPDSMHKNSNLEPNELWQKEVPANTRQLAIYEAIKAYKTSILSHKKFELKYKKRSTKQSFWIDSREIKSDWNLFVRRLKEDSKLHFNKEDTEYLKDKQCMHNTQIINDRGTWYMLYTYYREPEIINKPLHNVISLDPGVRTFQTGYAPDGVISKFGERQIDKIKKLHTAIDRVKHVYKLIDDSYNFKSTSTKIKSIKIHRCRRNLKKKEWRLNKKMYDVVSNLHNQVNAHLTNTYEHIILPTFNTHQMVQRDTISPSTKRVMNSLQFYRFKMKLMEQCSRKNRHLHIVSEAYTTMTCGSCGFLKRDVGTAEIYHCDRCEYTLDRDIHGARNILVRYLTKLG